MNGSTSLRPGFTWRRNLKHLAKWLLYCLSLMVLALTVLIVISAGHQAKANASNPSIEQARQARATCAAFAGPNAWFRFDSNGRVVCTNKRGDKLKEQPKAAN